MPHALRYIEANCLYEISFRARSSLPFPCTRYMELLILGSLARIQRDSKVIMHHHVWEGSHPHLLCTARDADSCQQFYGQLKKQLTDAIKRLTGKEHLSLWEDRASVIKIPTLDDAISKIGYIYANPSNDNLTSSIEEFPGVSSWSKFKDADALDSCIRTEHEWIQLPMIPRLPSRSVTPKQDNFVCEQMLTAARKRHVLEIFPNSWIALFIKAPQEADVVQILERCRENLQAREEDNCKRRARDAKKPMGKKRLREQPILAPHSPKKKSRRITVQSMHKDVRLQMIAELKRIAVRCRSAYLHWRKGEFSVPWPPGTFPPPLPPVANCFAG